MNVDSTAGQVVSTNASFPVEQKIARHHVAGDMNDHGIVGVAGSGMELNRDGAEHDFLFVIDVHGDAQTCCLGRHDVVAVVHRLQAETCGDVVGVRMGGDDVHQGEAFVSQKVNVLLHKVVYRVNQGRLFGGLVNHEVGHGPHAFVQLLKSHG